jgi:alpha-glucosidase (family GH31 glycosyl hydrolase)
MDVYLLTGSTLVHLVAVDFTSPDATAWYQPRFDQATDLGYTCWMYDFGEYTQPNVLSASGMSGLELHNLYPVLYHKAAYDHMQAGPLADDWVTYVRSGYTGSAPYSPLVWSGDPAASFDTTDGLPSMPRGAINMGIAGVPNWGGDIGGYHCIADGAGKADGEMLTRWIEQASTTPDMHDENACVGGDSSLKATIWSSADAQQAWKTYAKLHTRLEPYFYALACDAHQTGAPIVRHVFLENPDHPEWAGVDDVYYVGPSLLAAPVVARDARTKTLALPAGYWVDWQAQTLIQGGTQVTLDAPLDKLPLLLRDGSLVPLLDPTVDTLSTATAPGVVDADSVSGVLDVVGFLSNGKNASFTMCEGKTLTAAFSGHLAAPALPQAASADDLSTCSGCYLQTTLAGGLTRMQISIANGAQPVTAGGLTVGAGVAGGDVRLRWDLYILDQ